MFPRQGTELSLSSSTTCYIFFKTIKCIFFYTQIYFLEDIFLFIRRFSVFIKAQRLSCLYLPLVGVYYQEALHLFFCLSMLILNYSLVYSGIHSFMITRNSSFYSYSTSWIWLSFLFAVWIAHDFPKRSMLSILSPQLDSCEMYRCWCCKFRYACLLILLHQYFHIFS